MTRFHRTACLGLLGVLGLTAAANAAPRIQFGGATLGPRGGYNYYPGTPFYTPGFVYPGGTRFTTFGIGVSIGSGPSYFPYTNDYGRYSGLDSTLYFRSLNSGRLNYVPPYYYPRTLNYVPPYYYPRMNYDVPPLTTVAPRVITPMTTTPLTTPATSLPAPRLATTPDANAAVLRISAPTADAQILIDGHATRQRGLEREFCSPALETGHDYSYRVTARWTEGGKDVERSRTVPVRAGDRVDVDLRKP